MTSDLVIAIDGAAAVGKTTLCRSLAKELNLRPIHTGRIVRGLAVMLGSSRVLPTNLVDWCRELLRRSDEDNPAWTDPEVGMVASRLGASEKVKVALREALSDCVGCVLDGRDTTGYLRPDADVKLHVVSAFKVRVLREAKRSGKSLLVATNTLRDRDALDRENPQSILNGHVGRVVRLDTAGLSPSQVCSQALEIIENELNMRCVLPAREQALEALVR